MKKIYFLFSIILLSFILGACTINLEKTEINTYEKTLEFEGIDFIHEKNNDGVYDYVFKGNNINLKTNVISFNQYLLMYNNINYDILILNDQEIKVSYPNGEAWCKEYMCRGNNLAELNISSTSFFKLIHFIQNIDQPGIEYEVISKQIDLTLLIYLIFMLIASIIGLYSPNLSWELSHLFQRRFYKDSTPTENYYRSHKKISLFLIGFSLLGIIGFSIHLVINLKEYNIV